MVFLLPYVYVEITWNLKLQCYLEARKPSRLNNCLKILNTMKKVSLSFCYISKFKFYNSTKWFLSGCILELVFFFFFFAFVAHSKYISIKFTKHFRNISSQKKLFFINYFHLY